MSSSDEDVEMMENSDTDDMGYEDCAPQLRRGSMAPTEETQRRASIQAVMADHTLSPMTKRRSIQHLMDGRRNSMASSVASIDSRTDELNDQMKGGSSHSRHGRPRPLRRNLHSTDGQENVLDMYGYEDAAPDAVYSYDQAGGFICSEQTRRSELSRPVCTHYERKCTMIAPCCGAAFGCRICHDDCEALPPKINNGCKRTHRSASLPSSFTSMNSNHQFISLPEDNNHTIDRFAVVEIICRECFTRQSSKTNNCISCGVQFGKYHCEICNLWMSDEESPYHCNDCGFCRVGGKENFQHCYQCGMCIDRGLYATHNCKAGKYRSNCPVCQEYLFSSRGASHEMPCGHAIHWECFRQLAAHDSRCPVCKKTAETRERMMPTWNAMADSIALQPLPPDMARVVSIVCNDCERNEENRAWHFLGMQCSFCQSFNTVVDRILLQGEPAHEFLEINRQRAAILAEQAEQHGAERTSNGVGRRRRVNRRRSAF